MPLTITNQSVNCSERSEFIFTILKQVKISVNIKNNVKQVWWCDFFQEEEKINRISVESRVRKDRESD